MCIQNNFNAAKIYAPIVAVIGSVIIVAATLLILKKLGIIKL
jgi:hypothetical protein